MTISPPLPAEIDPEAAARLLRSSGFVAASDLPDRPGPAHLLVALRAHPTRQHFDPEWIELWTTRHGRGAALILDRNTAQPMTIEVSWGRIRLVDRVGACNDYVTFGGRLAAAQVGGALIAVFTSDAPILRLGGHSQLRDPGASAVGAFFGRLLLAVDVVPGFEARLSSADPVARYAAFVLDAERRSARERAAGDDSRLLAEDRRLRRQHPAALAAGTELLSRMASLEPMEGYLADR